MDVTCEGLNIVIADAIDGLRSELGALSQDIWQHPEIAFEEAHAHEALTLFFEKRGFEVTKNYALGTGFKAEYSSGVGGPNICLICEYDALPEIGHACGHNLIAETGAAAAIGIQAALNSTNGPTGKVTVLGTPGEEGGGGKVLMLDAGAFDGIDVVLMAHPGLVDCPEVHYLSTDSLTVVYEGKAAHASASPWEGVNALDAANIAYQSISCLRQQMKPNWRVSGIITHGGVRPNIIPERTELMYQMRAPNVTEVQTLKMKIIGCLDAAALATGCKVSIEHSKIPYASMKMNRPLLDVYINNAKSLGIELSSPETHGGSTDMGNVSHRVPGIHPSFFVGTPEAVHTREFQTAAGSDEAQFYTLRQGKLLAMTGVDLLRDTAKIDEIKQAFNFQE